MKATILMSIVEDIIRGHGDIDISFDDNGIWFRDFDGCWHLIKDNEVIV